ncbi:MAG: FAD-binding oxidoreductase [Alphaproteobacteria bacterium]|nr:FAD-binding oxidoreductase [Alphaproteobacteria bacterium]
MPAPPFEIVTDPGVLAGYLSDASNTRGHAEALVRPRSTAEVSAVVAWCQRHAIPLTVTAQRTSTTGGPVPEGGWLLSTERLDRVLAITDTHATAQAGVMLGAFQDELEARGRLYPPDPTSRDECSLGGSIACNASGARTYRYGPTRPWVEAVEVVLPTGEVRHADRSTPIPADWPRVAWTEPHVKTATGLYPADNLLDLFIGQEGILGVITQATVRLTARPERVFSVLIWFPSTPAGLDFVRAAKASAALSPRCLEWYDRHSLDLVRERVPEIPAAACAALWCEQECTEATQDALMEAWLAAIEASGALADDTLFADDPASLARLRAIRHAVPAGVNERVARNGMPKVGTDFAVPDRALDDMMAAYEATLLPHVLFGHVGDNHLHLNLLPRTPAELEQAWGIWRDLYARALAAGGTLSAEHGVGKLKRPYLAEMVGPEVISAFAALKRHLDPAWILGRGTMLGYQV